MTRESDTPTDSRTAPAAPAAVAVDNRDELSVTKLARGILSKDIRPRTGDVRRLAEAVLAGARPKKDKKARAEGGKKAKGKKKLAKIPGQTKK